MSKNTMTDLVEELTALNKEGKYDEMITEAKAGEYHDYKNQKYVCGKMELVGKLGHFPELGHIKMKVMMGEYDESPDTSDKASMMKDLVADMGEEKAGKFAKLLGLDKDEKHN